MKRLAVRLADIADRRNLLLAVAKAARGKLHRVNVKYWLCDLEARLAALAGAISCGAIPAQRPRSFTIHDPKTRVIGVAPFAERVLHHALLNVIEARFEQMLVPSSFACRPGKGVHAAVQHVQRQLRKYPWWLKMDVAGFFANVDHERLRHLLARRFKGREGLDLMYRIIEWGVAAGARRGLPIGALTSQHFANAYLNAADRWLLARCDVRGHVRYMDDIVVWCDSAAGARAIYQAFSAWLAANWLLDLKPLRVGRSCGGLLFCGFRVRRGIVLPSARKLARFRTGASAWANALRRGANHLDLQRAHDTLQATLAHTDSLEFRRRVWRTADPAGC